MPSYESFSFSQLDSSFRPKSPVQSQDLPRTSPELTINNTLNSRTGGHPSYAPDRAVIPWTAILRRSSSYLSGYVLQRESRTKCAATADIFGNLSDYAQHASSPPPQEDMGNGGDCDEGAPSEDVLAPLKTLERKRLRISAGVGPKNFRDLTSGSLVSKSRFFLPPEGRMRCLWGDDCAFHQAFDYTLDTIRVWKDHIWSHNADLGKRVEGSTAGVRTVNCEWNGCGEKIDRGYLFKHVVTHDVRFKLLCPRGCGVTFRDDNLQRHLRICRLGG